ncbi:hypothetical protein TNCV_2549691 [Trichonephila clavipes]|nr:hypothetical protein TNCV_2549691 [Trichonephila clavipes]
MVTSRQNISNRLNKYKLIETNLSKHLQQFRQRAIPIAPQKSFTKEVCGGIGSLLSHGHFFSCTALQWLSPISHPMESDSFPGWKDYIVRHMYHYRMLHIFLFPTAARVSQELRIILLDV